MRAKRSSSSASSTSSSKARRQGRDCVRRDSAMARRTFPARTMRSFRTSNPYFGGGTVYNCWTARCICLTAEEGDPRRSGLTSSASVSISRKTAVTSGSEPGYFSTEAGGNSCATSGAMTFDDSSIARPPNFAVLTFGGPGVDAVVAEPLLITSAEEEVLGLPGQRCKHRTRADKNCFARSMRNSLIDALGRLPPKTCELMYGYKTT
mmetsp:Transcript_58902/g.149226  ORF Transcript_58902/g.149226 Transcript_58902/m.149226 type:complete len:207 (-) Transcript_58902:1574-2194(-)